jgi:hypothetical protein
MTPRTILEEIRHVRHAISGEIGHDPRRIVDYYASLQADLKARLINRSGESTLTSPAATLPVELEMTEPATATH